MKKHNVVIVGGGFGGIKTALDLSDDDRFRITLITDHTDFRYYPSLYRTATGGKRVLSSIPLSELFAGKKINIINDTAISIDRKARTVLTKVKHVVGYDALVLAMGVHTNYFHIQGLEELSYGIKTIEDAEKLKHYLHDQLLINKKPDLNYVVVGGGPTGIELAAVLPAYIKQIIAKHGLQPRKFHVDLVEASPRLVPRSPKDISRRLTRQLRKLGVKLYLKTTVQAQTVEALMANNKPIRSHTVIWTAGVSNNSFFADQGFQLAGNSKVRVDQFLQTEMGIYVIGDNADTPYSGMAQTALYDGKFIARNLKLLANGAEPKPYIAKRPVYVFSAGRRWAAVQWGSLRIYGRLGWMLRSVADLIGYHDYEPWWRAGKRWVQEDDSEESCPTCRTSPSVAAK
ncbi:MAG: FAD-dependent oxidoreductase [Candidatus Saccharimonadales bacterium]